MAAKVAELKTIADTLFIKKDFGKAFDAYDAATKLISDGSGMDLVIKKAGCLLNLKK